MPDAAIEHKVISADPYDLEEILNEFGRQGWVFAGTLGKSESFQDVHIVLTRLARFDNFKVYAHKMEVKR